MPEVHGFFSAVMVLCGVVGMSATFVIQMTAFSEFFRDIVDAILGSWLGVLIAVFTLFSLFVSSFSALAFGLFTLGQ